MRRKLTALLILVLTLCIPSSMTSGVYADPIIHVNRLINVQKAGIVWYIDTIIISAQNGSEVSLDSLWIGLAEGYSPERVIFEYMQNGSMMPLSYIEKPSNFFTGYLLQFPSTQVLSGTQTLTLSVKYLFLETVFQTSDANKIFIQLFPLLEYNITSYNGIVNLPEGSEFQEIDALTYNVTVLDTVDQPWPVSINASSVRPSDNTSISVTYDPPTDDEFSVRLDSLTHEITPIESGIAVTETHTLTNIGRPFKLYKVKIPVNATNIWVKDHVGYLSHGNPTIVENVTDYATLTISARTNIFNLNIWSFTLGYDLPAEIYITDQTLTYNTGLYSFYAHDLETVFILPEGGSITSSTPEPTSIDSGSTTKYIYNHGARLPSESPSITIEYAYSPLPSWLMNIAGVVLIIGVLASLYYIKRRSGKSVSVEKISRQVKVPELSDYLSIYAERIILLKQYKDILENAEDNVSTLAEIARKLTISKRDINKMSRTIDDLTQSNTINKVNSAENEVERVQNDIRSLETRLRTRRITRRDYKKRMESRIERLERAIRQIEEALTSIEE